MPVVDDLVTLIRADVPAASFANLTRFRESLGGIIRAASATSLALAGIGVGLASLASRSIESTYRLETLSRTTALSTETLQRWQFATMSLGRDTQAFTNDLVKLQQTMTSPIPGQFNRYLMMMGISARNASGGMRSIDSVMLSLSRRLSSMSTASAFQWGKRLQLSAETVLFLREGPGVVQNRLNKANSAGLFSREMLDTVVEFKKTLGEFTWQWQVFSAQLQSQTIPIFGSLMDQFGGFLGRNGLDISQMVGKVIKGIIKGFRAFGQDMKFIWSYLGPIGKTISEFWRKIFPPGDDVDNIAHIVRGALLALTAVMIPFAASVAFTAIKLIALFAVAEDFINFLEGKDSVIGRILSYVGEMAVIVADAVVRATKEVKAFYDKLMEDGVLSLIFEIVFGKPIADEAARQGGFGVYEGPMLSLPDFSLGGAAKAIGEDGWTRNFEGRNVGPGKYTDPKSQAFMDAHPPLVVNFYESSDERTAALIRNELARAGYLSQGPYIDNPVSP